MFAFHSYLYSHRQYFNYSCAEITLCATSCFSVTVSAVQNLVHRAHQLLHQSIKLASNRFILAWHKAHSCCVMKTRDPSTG